MAGGNERVVAPSAPQRATAASVSPAEPARIRTLETARLETGAGLPPELRAQIERATSCDLSHVRVHASSVAGAAAAALDADAYADGRDLYFAGGRYAPGTPDGNRLIVHEAIHALQRPATERARLDSMVVSDPASRAESDADRLTDAILSGAPAPMHAAASAPAGTLHRQPAGAPRQQKKFATPEEEIMAGLLAVEAAGKDPAAATAALLALRQSFENVQSNVVKRVRDRIGKEKSTDTLVVVFKRALTESLQKELLGILDHKLDPSSDPDNKQQPDPTPVKLDNKQARDKAKGDMPGTIYVDAFAHARYDQDFIPPGKPRDFPSRWLTLTYLDGTVIYVDLEKVQDGGENTISEDLANTDIGDGGRIFPKVMNRYTTPGIYNLHEEYIAGSAIFEITVAVVVAQTLASVPAMPAPNPAMLEPITPPSRLAPRAANPGGGGAKIIPFPQRGPAAVPGFNANGEPIMVQPAAPGQTIAQAPQLQPQIAVQPQAVSPPQNLPIQTQNIQPAVGAAGNVGVTQNPSPGVQVQTQAAPNAQQQPNNNNNGRPPFVLPLPLEKAPHLGEYAGWVTGRQLMDVPNRPARPTDQIDVWTRNLRPGGGEGMNPITFKRGVDLGLSIREILIPTWSRASPKRGSVAFQVDHKVELQVTNPQLLDVFHNIHNFELLDSTSNVASRNRMFPAIQAQRVVQDAADPAGAGLPRAFDVVTMIGGRQGTRWTKEEIKNGEHLDVIKP